MKIKLVLLYLASLTILISCTTDPRKVVCIGDSITEGAGLANQSQTSYPVVLGRLLGELYTVQNCGRSATTLQKEGDFPYWICKEFSNVFAYNPDIIVIKLGTNDTKPQNWNAERFEKDYQALIDTLNSIKSNPNIYLCLPVPVYKTAWGINDSTITKGVIPAIKHIAAANNIPIIDLYSSMSNQAENFPDGVHPNENGAINIATVIASEIGE